MDNSTSSEKFNSFSYWQFNNDVMAFDETDRQHQSSTTCETDAHHEPLSRPSASSYYYEMKFDHTAHNANRTKDQKNNSNPFATSPSLITTTRFLATGNSPCATQTSAKMKTQQPLHSLVNDALDIYDLTDDLDKGFLADDTFNNLNDHNGSSSVFSRIRTLIGLVTTNKPTNDATMSTSMYEYQIPIDSSTI